jgi:PAS domain S-box-containing protein
LYISEAKLTGRDLQTIMSNRGIATLEKISGQTQLLDAAINASKSGIIITDRLHPDNPIIFCNKAFEEMTGYLQEEILGKDCRFLQGTDREQKGRYILRSALQKGEACTVELANYRKDGTIFWNELHITPIKDASGEITHYIGIQNDISQRKNKEISLRLELAQSQKMQLLKDEFISIASHELKTPITSLKATLQLMNRMIGETPAIDQKLVKLAQNGERHTTKLTHLVDDLLDSTKAEQGELALNKEKFLLADVIDGCCSHLFLDGKFKIRYEGDHSVEICADQHKIDQVMINFVNNAVKYAPATEEILITVEREGDCIKVSVKDQGRGIPPEDKPHIFKRYYRAENETQVSGLGLGLYIASEIIKKHGGEIGVDSEPDKGSTFWFTLPCEN